MQEQKTTQALSVAQNNTPGFLADATTSLANMQAYAEMLINSGLVPKHFYELDQYKNPIKPFKGNTAAVIMTIQHGLELGMSITQSLQQIVPVNGLMSLKGDAAKALIMRSGLCKEWIEEEIGTPGTDSFGVKITSKRTDGQTISRSFTIQDAKRAGLWIDEAAVKVNDKLKHSPWFKYQNRMLRYRALGFISRDLYGDVLQNMYTEDEARDINEDNTMMVTQEGMTVSILATNSNQMNENAKEALNSGPAAVKDKIHTATRVTNKRIQPTPVQEAVEVKEEPKEEPQQEATEGVPQPYTYTKVELDAMKSAEVLGLVNQVLGIDVDTQLFVGANKEKRVVGWLKKLVLAKQDGTLEAMLKKDFNVNMADLYAQPEEKTEEQQGEKPTGKKEALDFTISEAPEGGRDFAEIMVIDTKCKELGITNQFLLSFIQEQELEYDSVENFYRNAPSDTLLIAMGL